MQRKLFLIPILLILAVGIIHAQENFEVNVVEIKDKIIVDEVAEYDITVVNNFNNTEDFTIKKAGYPFWDMYTKPLQNPITVQIPPKQSATTRIYLDPVYITSVDTYTLEAGVVHDRTGFEIKAPITVGIKSTDPLISGYVPTVTTTVDVPASIDPRDQFTIKVRLNNQNIIDYPDLTVKIESSFFSEDLYVPLGPKEEKTVELTKKLSDDTAPKQDRFVVAVLMGDKVIVNPIVKDFQIEQYYTKKNLDVQKALLMTKKGFEITSNNPQFVGEISTPISGVQNLFVSTSPRASKVKENGVTSLVWDIKFNGNKTMQVYYTENYRPLVVIILLTIAAVILYFVFRSPIVVSKSIASVATSEGGVSEAKVVVKVKNRSADQLTSIEVIDHLPHIAHVEKELSIGSMQPHAIMQHPKRGLIIKWTIEALEAGDERVLSYRMKSRLAILGEFNLPIATARIKIGDKVVITNSNRVSVGVGMH